MARQGFGEATEAAAAADRLSLDDTTLDSLAAAADPDLALRSLERLTEAAGREVLTAVAQEDGLRRRLLAVLGASSALGDHLVTHPEDWRLLREDGALPSLGTPGDADEL